MYMPLLDCHSEQSLFPFFDFLEDEVDAIYKTAIGKKSHSIID